MGPDDSLYRAVAAAPDDLTLRLVYADYLDEHAHWPGAAARAEFIRSQCELERLAADDPRRGALQARADDLLRKNRGHWNGPLHRHLHRAGLRDLVGSRRRPIRGWGYRRGFPETLSVQAATFLEHADLLLHLGPISELRLFGSQGLGRELAASQHVSRSAVLDFTNDRVADQDLLFLIAAPNLRPGVVLRLRGHALTPGGVGAARGWQRRGRGVVEGLETVSGQPPATPEPRIRLMTLPDESQPPAPRGPLARARDAFRRFFR